MEASVGWHPQAGSSGIRTVREDESTLDGIEAVIAPSKIQAVGVVVSKVDEVMHGAELGIVGMDSQVQLWGEQGYLSRLLILLFDHGYDVFLTSDHGNIEATGCGRPKEEGSMADVRGQRVRIYPTALLREEIAAQFPEAVQWSAGNGLPPDYWPLLAGGRTAFITCAYRTVSHGGACIEEVVVPFVRVQRGVE